MLYLDLSRVLVLLTTLAITYGSYEQVWKIWRSRSVRDLSLSLVFAWVINEVAWVNYGFVLGEWPIWVMSLLGLPAAIGGAWGYWKFRDVK